MRTLLTVSILLIIAGSAGAKPVRFANPAADCIETCERLALCKVGPLFDNKNYCERACEAAAEDERSGKTYDCVDKAKTCAAMRKCGK